MSSRLGVGLIRSLHRVGNKSRPQEQPWAQNGVRGGRIGILAKPECC